MYADGKGLWLRVSAPKAASWCFRYMLDRQAHEMGLGSYGKADGISLKRAREKAAEQRRIKAEGQSPLAIKREAKAKKHLEEARTKTFKQCAESYIEAKRPEWKNEKHAWQWENTLERFAYPVFKDLPVASIDTALVMDVLKPIWNTKTETATRLRGRIESILDWAATNGYRKGENPARWRGHLQNLLARPSKVARVEHHPALSYAEIGGFMALLRERKDTTSHALEFCILTATRTGEVIGAKWNEINLKDKTWTIPAERMKAGKEHRLPLSARAVEILESQPKGNSDAFVFRGRDGGALSNMAMLMLLRRLEKTDIVVHGFRSTFRDWAGETTAHPREVIEHALSHQLKDATEAAYQRGDLFIKRRVLMDDWAQYCEQLPVAEGDNVVPMRKI